MRPRQRVLFHVGDIRILSELREMIIYVEQLNDDFDRCAQGFRCLGLCGDDLECSEDKSKNARLASAVGPAPAHRGIVRTAEAMEASPQME